MKTLDDFDLPLSGMEEALANAVTEVVDLRYGEAGDPGGKITGVYPETVPEILDLLRRARTRADRIDHLYSTVMRAQGRARRALKAMRLELGTQIDEATVARGERRAQFEAHAERRADVNVKTLEQRRLLYQAENLLDVATEAVDVIKQIHFELADLRKELTAHIRALQFESSLER